MLKKENENVVLTRKLVTAEDIKCETFWEEVGIYGKIWIVDIKLRSAGLNVRFNYRLKFVFSQNLCLYFD